MAHLSAFYANRDAQLRKERAAHSFAPGSMTYQGSRYYATGKYGTDIATGQPSAEYEDDSNRRLWLIEDGTVKPD